MNTVRNRRRGVSPMERQSMYVGGASDLVDFERTRVREIRVGPDTTRVVVPRRSVASSMGVDLINKNNTQVVVEIHLA